MIDVNDVSKYFDDLMDKIDTLTDEEFDQLLIESGIENCDKANEGEYRE